MSATTKSVLRSVGTANIEASAMPFDPGVVATRSGLYVYESFVKRVRKHASKTESMGALALPYSDLDEDANDFQIGAALGDGYEFSATKLCYVIDRLISRQPNGESGDLLNNGYATLFYVEGGPVVRVFWLAGLSEWRVSGWLRYGGRCFRGRRAFRN